MGARPDRVRPAGLLAAAALALLLHALLLGGLEIGPGAPAVAPVPAPVQVRSVTLPPPALDPETDVDPPPAAARPGPAPAAAPPAPRPARAAPPEPPPADVPDRPGPPAPAALPDAADGAGAPAPEAAASEPGEATPALLLAASAPALAAGLPGSEPPPVYPTVLPPAVTLDYELRRGMLTGSATLSWRPEGGRYELQLDGSVIGLRVLSQLSRGRLDAHGLAPERFTDQRARRSMQAANFRRDTGRISFSGPTHELPLYPGVQDRLSWMVQLPAIVAADPALRRAGQRILLQAVGARGDSALWAVQVLGPATVQTRAGTVATLHLRREPRGPYDTRVEVWLDPARHHLPLRATLQSGDEAALELQLR